MKNCLDLQNYLSDGVSSDIVAFELYEELLVFRNTVEKDTNMIKVLNFLKRIPGTFPNILVYIKLNRHRVP